MQFLAPLIVVCTAVLLQNLHNKRLCNYDDMVREGGYNISFTDSELVKTEMAFFQIMRAGKQDAIVWPKANAFACRKFLLLIILLSGDVSLNPSR